MQKKVALLILDGWGHGTNPKADAINQANTPFIDELYKNHPNATLTTYGEQVGLPKGQMGNSEVGHLNIGAGRIVYQELLKINNAIEDGSFKTEEGFLKSIDYCKQNRKPLHLMGLVSDGGVHSHINHLKALIELAEQAGVKKYYIHAFTDGRDVNPDTGIEFIKDLEEFLANKRGQLVSVCGRYYAMDRDKRWHRTKLAYDLLTKGVGEECLNFEEAITNSYRNNITDEFLEPMVKITPGRFPVARIESGDAVICFNFRTDRCRQITHVLTQAHMKDQGMVKKRLNYTTMTNYDKGFTGISVVYDDKNLTNTLGEVLEQNNKSQLRAAETEKYPHVTFFFNGGREEAFKDEYRIMEPSPKVATYDLQPEMSAQPLTLQVIKMVQEQQPDFICLNFANADMVGHTGDLNAAIKACETVDECVKQMVGACLEQDYSLIIIADHGNSDYMINEDGSPNTAHTVNPVPIIVIDKDVVKVENGKLADLAPTILNLMDINCPEEMDGEILTK